MDAGIAKVIDAEQEFFQRYKNFTSVSTEEMLAEMYTAMEPVFRANGWRKPAENGVHSIFLQHSAANGDLIMATPFIRELRNHFSKSHITLMVPASCWDLAKICPYVDEVLVTPKNTCEGKDTQKIISGLLEFMPRLLKRRFDLGFVWSEGANIIEKLWLYLSGACERVGHGKYMFNGVEFYPVWHKLLTFSVIRDGDVSLREWERHLHLLEAFIKVKIANKSLEVWTDEGDERSALAVLQSYRIRGLKNFYAIMPGASEARRRWPKERWAELSAQILQKEPGTVFMILGGPKEENDARYLEEYLTSRFPGRACSVAGKLSFRGTAALLKHCRKYLGNDTGTLHIAVAQKIPVLVPYPYGLDLGMRTVSAPVRFAPSGVSAVQVFPKEHRDDCHEMDGNGCSRIDEVHCILGISVETMFNAYELLNEQIAKGNVKPIRMC